ncbi:TetR/AcrR family transcriptional regulator, partial [Acinetobacter baumannii]
QRVKADSKDFREILSKAAWNSLLDLRLEH